MDDTVIGRPERAAFDAVLGRSPTVVGALNHTRDPFTATCGSGSLCLVGA